MVVRQKTGSIGRNLSVQHLFHGQRKGLKNRPFLHVPYALKHLNIVWVDGKEADELLEPLVHVPVKAGKLLQVLPDFALLLCRFL